MRQPHAEMAYITGWRVTDEILPLEWRNVDFQVGEVRLDDGRTKNGDGRVFPMTIELRRALKAQHAAHEVLKKAGHLFPNVFWRMVAEERGGEKKPRAIKRFEKEWRNAVRAAGCPHRIPHDLRRTAIRNFVRSGTSETVAMTVRAQDAGRVRPLQHCERRRSEVGGIEAGSSGDRGVQ
jgi:integrase